MNKTIKNLLVLAATIVLGTGQAWAGSSYPGKIYYAPTTSDGGSLTFACDANFSIGISINGTTHWSADWSDVLSSGVLEEVTKGSDVVGYTVYIKAAPDAYHKMPTITIMQATKTPTARMKVKLSTEQVTIPVSPVDGHPGIFRFTMPKDETYNVEVSATFPEKVIINGVTYIGNEYDIIKEVTEDNVCVLDGTETSLAAGTYIALPSYNGTDLDLTKYATITLTGDVKIILADGATMTVTAPNGGKGIDGGQSYSLTICGQSNGDNAGVLNVSASGANSYGIYVQNFDMYSGKLNVTGADIGIFSNNSSNIWGGSITMTGIRNTGFFSNSSIYFNHNQPTLSILSAGTGIQTTYGVYFYTGQVDVTGGTKGIDGDIELSWKEASDFFKCSSYDGDVTFAGSFFLNIIGGGIYVNANEYDKHTIPDDGLKAALADIKIIPAKSVKTDGAKYMVIVNNKKGEFSLPAGVVAYVPTGYNLTTGEVTLTQVQGIPASGAFILANATEGNNLPSTIDMTSVAGTEAGNSIENEYQDIQLNDHFITSSGKHTFSALIDLTVGTEVNDNNVIIFIFDGESFKPLSVSYDLSSVTPEEGQLFLIVSTWDLLKALSGNGGGSGSGNSRQRTLRIDMNGGTTGIVSMDCVDHATDRTTWFTLDGRKLNQAPTAKGVYIRDGRKVIIR